VQTVLDTLFGDAEGVICGSVRSPEDLREVVPSRGQTAVVTTDAAMSAWHWLPVLCDPTLGHGHCRRAVITTYNLSQEAVGGLESLLRGHAIELADVVLSDAMSRVGDGGEVYGHLEAVGRAYPGRFRWAAQKIHAKTIGLHMASGLTYTVVGSGNMAYNTHHEAYVLLTDEAAFLHLATWVGGMFH